jgi:hypothetical protein
VILSGDVLLVEEQHLPVQLHSCTKFPRTYLLFLRIIRLVNGIHGTTKLMNR